MREKRNILDILGSLNECDRKILKEKLNASSLEDAAAKIEELAQGRVFIHFKEKIKNIEEVEYINEFPELKMASAKLDPKSLVRVLLDNEVRAVERVPELAIDQILSNN